MESFWKFSIQLYGKNVWKPKPMVNLKTFPSFFEWSFFTWRLMVFFPVIFWMGVFQKNSIQLTFIFIHRVFENSKKVKVQNLNLCEISSFWKFLTNSIHVSQHFYHVKFLDVTFYRKCLNSPNGKKCLEFEWKIFWKNFSQLWVQLLMINHVYSYIKLKSTQLNCFQVFT